MNYFPMLDPIPLPAPVWLFKILHILTLALHFIAVMILLGGLLMATLLAFFGGENPLRRGAAAALARRLPIVMTYVINLGVPPLLFAQVLYGPALYTSNVLIGAYWFSIVFLLMGCYWCLYKFSDAVSVGKNAWWLGLIAWLLAGCISRILSTNMALMLRPEDWNGMYSLSAFGGHLPPYDPTLMPRWLFMIAGGFAVSGLWMVWIAGRKSVQAPLNQYLARLGGSLTAVMILVQTSQFYSILQTQPAVVQDNLNNNPLFFISIVAWYVLAGLIFVYALWALFKKPCSYLAGYIAALLVLLSVSSWTIVRDGIRDYTLLSKGYDVWQQQVVTNWSVVAIFLGSFVLGIVTLVWLISVMMRAKTLQEGAIS